VDHFFPVSRHLSLAAALNRSLSLLYVNNVELNGLNGDRPSCSRNNPSPPLSSQQAVRARTLHRSRDTVSWRTVVAYRSTSIRRQIAHGPSSLLGYSAS